MTSDSQIHIAHEPKEAIETDKRPVGWLSLLLWVIASAVGWGLIPFLVLGVVLPVLRVLFSKQMVMGMSEFSYTFQGAIFGIILGILFGLTISVLQWLVLRRHITKACWWIAATVTGLSLGIPLGIVALRSLFAGPTAIGGPSYFIILAAIVPGIIVGLLQQMALQQHFSRAWWWMLPSALTWPVPLIYLFEGVEVRDAGLLAGLGLILGTISGIALFFISRKRKEDVVTGTARAAIRRRFPIKVVTAVLLLVFITAVSLFLTNVFSARSPLLTLKGHTDGVTDVVFSPDGALLASGSMDGTVRIWRADDGELLHTLKQTGDVFSVNFSPDGETLASGAGNNAVKLWRVTDGTLLYTLPNAGHRVAFSPDGSTLASVGMSQTLQLTVSLWRVADGEAIRTLETGPVTEFCNSLAFSPDGATLAGGFQDGVVLMWSVESGALLHTLRGHNRYSEVYVAFSPNGKILASGSHDARIRFWRVDDGAFLHEATGDLSSVSGIAFSADGSTLVSVSYDYTVRFWCAADGKPIGALAREEHDQQSVAFSPDLKTMASGDMLDGIIRIYGIERGE
jgi:sugar lactone lactonase YvrE